MGLGLSICQTIAKAHGGSLFVEETSTQGTTFVLDLPSMGETR